MSDEPDRDGVDLAAWNAFCDSLRDAGQALLGPEFPSEAHERAEGFRHLAQQAACWLTWGVGHQDAEFPSFMRQNDRFTQWGGSNADNMYRHVRVDPAGTYRIRGRMHSCEEFLLAVRIGNMHEERYGTLHESTATDLGIGPGEDFEIVLGGPELPSRWLPLPAGARMVTIREYYYDWLPREPAVMTIERLDDAHGASRPARPTPASVASGLTEATTQFAGSIRYWNEYMRAARARGEDNTFIPPRAEPKGLKGLVYAFCFHRLEPGEALIVECERPLARYWSFQLYSLAWFEPVDSTYATGSLNHRQITPGPDGRVRVVVAAEDPGVAGWLDTGGRREGLLTFRCAWSDNRPLPTARVVAVADLPDLLPRVTPAARRAELAARSEHAAWRFRT